jgi:hypothetical protein
MMIREVSEYLNYKQRRGLLAPLLLIREVSEYLNLPKVLYPS